MIYRCLVCDIPLTVGTLPAHAAWHGWHLEQTRDQGIERDGGIVTHEFGTKGGAALFWLTRHLNPLMEEPDV